MCSAGCLGTSFPMDVSKVIETVDELVMGGRELSQLAADFTWYLRNLLLVKCSDDMEDVLDVSTENLAQLKEEAGMIENETLIRYIRIFSDLTSQLRYSTQKRVLLEVTLIKLCRPAMEQNSDALLDRIRLIEKQLEEGVAVRVDAEASVLEASGRRKGGAPESETGASQGPERGCKSSGEGFSEYCRGCISHAPDISEESALKRRRGQSPDDRGAG